MSAFIDPVIPSLEDALGGADPVQLLLAAESGGYGADPTLAPRAAATAVLQYLGFPVGNYNSLVRGVIIEIVLTQLQGLRYLTTGATIALPRGNTYAYRF